MNKNSFRAKYSILILSLSCFLSNNLTAQFQVNKSAFKTSDRCWTLTPDQPTQVGSVWYDKKLDLSQSFDLTLSIFLGCRTDGADGIVFGLQPLSTSAGSTGQGIGLGGVKPSIGVEFDTFQNGDFGDPPYDHVAIVRDGDMNHFHTQNTLAGPVPVKIGTNNLNFKDCRFHDVRFTWDAPNKKFSVYWECTLLISTSVDFVTDIFGGDPNVYWGFTAATGGKTNEQKMCLKYTSLLDKIADTVLCRGGQIQLSASGGVKYNWLPSTGLSNPSISNPIARPDKTTKYTVQIIDTCGNKSIDTLTVRVGGNPYTLKLGNDTVLCAGQSLLLNPNIAGAKFVWQNGSKDSTFLADKTGLYKVNVDKNYCLASDSIKVRVINSPTISLGGNATLCFGIKKILTVSADDANFTWQDGSSLTSYVITQPGLYSVLGKNNCGSAFDSFVAEYQKCHNAYIPNIFSPNGDGINDTWQIYSGNDVAKILSVKVFNRWGRLMYEASDISYYSLDAQWDGKDAANGVYMYLVNVAYTDGDTELFTGNVTITR